MFDCNLIQVVTKACLTVEVTPTISPRNKSDTVEPHYLERGSILVKHQTSIIYLYHGKNKLHFDELTIMMSALYSINTLS